MKLFQFLLHIDKKINNDYFISITDDTRKAKIIFNTEEKTLTFIGKNSLSSFLQKHEYQFRKILHNKKVETFFEGFQLKFVIWENKNMLDYNNNQKIITFDHRKKEIYCSFDNTITPQIIVYTDGSFNEQKKMGALSVIIKNTDGYLNLFTQTVKAHNNNEVELRAAIKALELTKDFSTILLYTDSRYVKKGITEWIFYWQVNNWMTANGTRAKNITLWKKFLSLTVGRSIQFGWIKGHAETLENKLCDYYAKRSLKRFLNDTISGK